MTTRILHVPDISCEHCEHTIVQTLHRIEGVGAVSVDIPSHTVNVTYDEARVSLQRLRDALAEEDYAVASAD